MVWLQSVFKIGNKMMWCGESWYELVYSVSLLVDKRIHNWKLNHLTGCIWNCPICRLDQLAADVLWVD